MRMRKTLTSRFGFNEADIVVLVDTDKHGVQPTGANIRSGLQDLIAGAEAGDVLVFQFCGHGSRDAIPAEAGADDGLDEAIFPTDSNPLTDDDFRKIVEKIPARVKFTFISDSCNSGGLIDEMKEQIGDAEKIHQQVRPAISLQGKPKQMTVEMLTSTLSDRSGHPVEVGNIRTKLFDMFRDDASLSVKRFENLVLQQINQKEDEAGLKEGKVSPLAVEFLQSKLAHDQHNYLAPAKSAGVYCPRSRSRRPVCSKKDDVGILLSGCQSHEFSQDCPGDGPEDAFGMFTKAIETVLSRLKKPHSNREMILAYAKCSPNPKFPRRSRIHVSTAVIETQMLCSFVIMYSRMLSGDCVHITMCAMSVHQVLHKYGATTVYEGIYIVVT